MNINERITVNDNELFVNLDEKLDKLQKFRFDSKYRALLGDSIVEKLSTWEKNIKKQKDVPLTVVVCGEFKRGKSSLINAILGETVVTTNITTETITVNRISYGEHSNEIVLSGGKRVTLTDEELRCENLEGILAQLSVSDKITVLELKRPLEILKDITIIDTPGLGDSVKDFTEEVDFALRQADAVIYVFAAGYPLSMQEQFFIRTAIKPQKYTELFLVANFCDMFEEKEDFDRMRNVIRKRLANVLPDEEPVMVSALDERSRQLKTDAPNEAVSEILGHNFDEFRKQLDELLTSKRHFVIPDRVERMINAMMLEMEKELDVINAGLSADFEELKKKRIEIEDIKKEQTEEYKAILAELDEKFEDCKSNARGWISEFVDKLERDTDNLSEFSSDDIKKYYSVFCVDALQNAIDKCNEYFVEAVYEQLNEVSGEVAKKMSMNENKKSTDFSFNLNTHTWTKGDNIEFYNSVFLGGIPNLLVTFVAGTLRENELKKNVPDLVKNIKAQFPGLRSSIIPALDKNYGEIANTAKKLIVEHFDGSKEALDKNLEVAEVIAKQDEDKKLEIKMAVEEISATLNQIKSELSA